VRPRVLVRDPAKARQGLGEQIEQAVGELDRPETVEAALAGVDRVFLLTTQSSQQPKWERSVIEAATRAGVGHLVKLSVFRADERSPLQIARQHGQAERALAESGVASTVLRPLFFMQNLLGMACDGTIATAAGDGRVAMVDARDVAAVAVAVLTSSGHEGKVYTLSGPRALSFDEVARICSRQTGRPFRHLRVPPDAVRNALQAIGVPAWFAGDMAKLQEMLAAAPAEPARAPGHSTNPKDERPAMPTEDHPMECAAFEGVKALRAAGGPAQRPQASPPSGQVLDLASSFRCATARPPPPAASVW
jgi:uncharacterized protein YbjT (DUF2867 family)